MIKMIGYFLGCRVEKQEKKSSKDKPHVKNGEKWSLGFTRYEN